MALMLMLVCVTFSGIVLAASTAAAGQAAERSKQSQRYYAVTSAVGLFEEALGDDGIASYRGVQSWTDESGIWVPGVTLDRVDEDAASASYYDFLRPVTCCALYGSQSTDETNGATAKLAAKTSPTGWVELFGDDSVVWDTSNTPKFVQVNFEVDPTNAGAVGGNQIPNSDNMKVAVEGRLYEDLTLELDFKNEFATGNTADSHDATHMFVRLQGSIVDNEYLGSSRNEKVANVDWRILSVTPGRGF